MFTPLEKAIREFAGKDNAGLRAKIRRCETPAQVRSLAGHIALTGSGLSKLEACAEALEDMSYEEPVAYVGDVEVTP